MACKHCGYEIGVHSALSYRCPGDDPYEMKKNSDRIFLDTDYEDEDCASI